MNCSRIVCDPSLPHCTHSPDDDMIEIEAEWDQYVNSQAVMEII
jgi:hypothetical protein